MSFDIPSLARLQNGSVLFKFRYRGSGLYDVFVARKWGGEKSLHSESIDIHIGQTWTTSAISRSSDPGAWRVEGSAKAFDSMNDAAAELLTGADLKPKPLPFKELIA